MVEVNYEDEVEVECPKCKHKFTTVVNGTVEYDPEPTYNEGRD